MKNLERMASQVQSLFQFKKISISQLHKSKTSSSLRTFMIKHISIHINASPLLKPLLGPMICQKSSDSDITKRPLHRRTRYEDYAVVFCRENIQIKSEYHNRPLYITVPINDVALRQGLVDPRSSLNIMPPSTLDVVGVPREYMLEQSIEISGFRGDASVCYVNVDMTVRPI